MKQVIPAVFFQKHLQGVKETVQKPERLELFESELREIVGGFPNQGGEGTDTYTLSQGWADVLYPDDCGGE